MKPSDIVRRRLFNSGLTKADAVAAQTVVRHHAALQSQDYGPAKWSIGQRCARATDEDVDRALMEGGIVRTHVLRPTWHFVARDDLRWLLRLTGPRVQRQNARRYRDLGLEAATLERGAEVLTAALVGGRRLTRKQLSAALEDEGIDTSGQRLAYLVMHCELEAVVCSGGLDGKQQTYTLVDERVPKGGTFDRGDALRELVRRYLGSHGPATTADLAWWSGLTVADIKEGLAALGSTAEEEVVDGLGFWSLAGQTEPPPARGAHLLQAFDEVVVGYTRSRFFGDPGGDEVRRRQRRRDFPTGLVLVDGLLAGHWRRTTARTALNVEIDLFRDVGRRGRAAVDAELERLGGFVGTAVNVAAFRISA